MKILLGHFNAKFGREDIFKVTTGNERLHLDSNVNGVRLVNIATSKNLVVKSTMFSTETFINTHGSFLMGRLNNRVDHIRLHRRWHSNIVVVQSFRRADCDTDH
jgi:hypothetical protein